MYRATIRNLELRDFRPEPKATEWFGADPPSRGFTDAASGRLAIVALAAGGCKAPGKGAAESTLNVAGGEATEAYPSVVRIDYPGGPCTGTVVAKRVILTAAHCVRNRGTVNVPDADLAPRYTVTIGTTELTPAAVYYDAKFQNPDLQGHKTMASFRGAWFKMMPFDTAALVFQADLPEAPMSTATDPRKSRPSRPAAPFGDA